MVFAFTVSNQSMCSNKIVLYMMAAINEVEERKHFFKVAEALIYAGNILETYTVNGLVRLHRKIYKRQPRHLRQCNSMCSRVFGTNVKSWCDTCKHWRRELEVESRYNWKFQKIAWKQQESWKWCLDYKNIMSVFISRGNAIDISKVKLTDLSTALSLWDNCKEFNIPQNTIHKLRELRNKYFGHNTEMKVPYHKFIKIFNIIGVLFREHDIRNHIDSNAAVDMLEKIKSSDKDECSLKRIEADLEKTKDQGIKTEVILNKIQEQLKQQETLNYSWKVGAMNLINSDNIIKFIVLLVALYLMIPSQPKQTTSFPRKHGNCLPESYSIPFTTDLLLEGYVFMKHGRLVGRRWLIDEVQKDLIHQDPRKKGIILTADMGYGKSVFVSHLICAEPVEPGYDIRNYLLAYHVCKFDVSSTKNPAVFIRRLVGLIGLQIPEYGSYVSMLPNTSMVFDKNICEQDPNGCFDQAVVFPLLDLVQPSKGKQIIILDALDECSDGERGINRISELIRLRAHALPSWIKLLLTSRNEIDRSFTKSFDFKSLSTNDDRNLKDIKTYIEDKNDKSILKLQHLFGSSSNSDVIEKLVTKSGGNFLFLTHALEYWESQNGTLRDDDIPQTLDRIYELNFERLFGHNGQDYTNAKAILEVICSSLYQMHENELANILQVGEVSHMTEVEFKKAMQLLYLVLKKQDSLIMFAHISIRNWLISNINSKFSVSLQTGASKISEHLFHTFQLQSNVKDIGRLALHIALSNNTYLEEKFKSAMKGETKNITKGNVLHDIVQNADLPNAVDLVSAHYQNIDLKDENGLTASSLAVIHGHMSVLKRLIELKANITVVAGLEKDYHILHVPGRDISSDVEEIINLCPYEGYNLLHFAAQFGQLPMMEVLMSSNSALVNSKNLYGRLPLHLACEYGKDSIVKYFLEVQSLQADLDCLYLAAKNQHEFIVQIILDSKTIEYTCISDDEARNAYLALAHNNNNTEILGPSFFPWFDDIPWPFLYFAHILRPLDIWWKIKKETPLHTAAQTGHEGIFRRIVSAYPNALDCVDSGGLTPMFTSIRYQKLEIFKLCLERKTENLICPVRSELIQELHSKFRLNQDSCVPGMTVTHFLAVYGNHDFIQSALKYGVKMDFYSKDDDGVTPLHYAACHGNAFLLFLSERLRYNINVVSPNGSTPYHSAAACVSLAGLMSLEKIGHLPLVVDLVDMSFLHYLFCSPVDKPWGYLELDKERQVNQLLFFTLEHSTADLLMHKDNTGKNFLHYAIRYGHFYGVKLFLALKAREALILLNQKDNNGQNPVTYAMNKLERVDKNVISDYRVPKDLHYLDLFLVNRTEQTTENLIWFMSPVELSIFSVMQFARRHGIMDELLNIHFKSLMTKSKMYPVSYLLLSNRNTSYNFDQQIIEAIRERPEPFNIFTLIVLRPETFFTCNNSDSAIHLLVDYIDDVLEYIGESDAQHLVKFLFKDRLRLLGKCLDSLGRPIYERAIKRKSLLFITRLIKNNMMQLQLHQRAYSILSLVMSLNSTVSSPFITRMHYQLIVEGEPNKIIRLQKIHKGRDYVKNLKDALVVQIIHKLRQTNRLDIFCKNGTRGFSLVHLAAASNMYQTVDHLLKYRHDILNCITKDRVTPLYLAKMFKAEETLKLLKNRSLILPTEQFQKVLIFKLSTSFCDSDKRHALFWLINNTPQLHWQNEHNVRKIIRLVQNILSKKKEFHYRNYVSVYVWPVYEKTLQLLRRGISIMNEMLSDKIKRKSCRPYHTFLTTFQSKLNQLGLDFQFSGYFDVFIIPDHLKIYSYLWKNTSLFDNFYRCSVVRNEKNLIIILRSFAQKTLLSALNRLHEHVFERFVRQEVLVPFQKVEGHEVYFNITQMYRHKSPISVESIVRYRFIDCLKAFSEKDSFRFLLDGS